MLHLFHFTLTIPICSYNINSYILKPSITMPHGTPWSLLLKLFKVKDHNQIKMGIKRVLRYDKEHPNIFIIVEMQIVTAVNFHFLPIAINGNCQ